MTLRERSITRVMEQIQIRRDLLARMRAGEGHRLYDPVSTETQRVTALVTLLARVSAVTPILDEATSLGSFQSTLMAPVLELAAGAHLWLEHFLRPEEISVCVLREREQQDAEYGATVVGYRASDWAAALTEEVGEVAREAFRADHRRSHRLAVELGQVLALAVWWLEWLQISEAVEDGRGRLHAQSAPAADGKSIELLDRCVGHTVCANKPANSDAGGLR